MGKLRQLGVVRDIDLVSLADINSLTRLITLSLGILFWITWSCTTLYIGKKCEGVCNVTIPHLLECSSNAFL